MNDTPIAAQSSDAGRRRQPGQYLFPLQDVPVEVRQFVESRLQIDAEGNPKRGASGEDIKITIATAKENGSYYGPVVLNNSEFIVQAVGREQTTAVVHSKAHINLEGASLNALNEQNRMHGFNVQVHYKADVGKAYPYRRHSQEQSEQREASRSVADVFKAAREYATSTITNAGQRTTFLNHLDAIEQQLQPARAQEERPAAQQAPAKSTASPQRDAADVER